MWTTSLQRRWTAARYDYFLWRNGLREADKIVTHLTDEEKRELFNLVRKNRPLIVAEIGSYLGASATFLAAAISKFVPESRLYCIDTWQNDAMDEEHRDTYDNFVQNTSEFARTIRPIRGRSIDAATRFNDRIDLLFIDGDHSYNAVKEDWTHWSPLLSSGACVVMHDVGWAAGVQRVVTEEIQPLAAIERWMPNLYWAILVSH